LLRAGDHIACGDAPAFACAAPMAWAFDAKVAQELGRRALPLFDKIIKSRVAI
jgi:hypothetical protein